MGMRYSGGEICFKCDDKEAWERLLMNKQDIPNAKSLTRTLPLKGFGEFNYKTAGREKG